MKLTIKFSTSCLLFVTLILFSIISPMESVSSTQLCIKQTSFEYRDITVNEAWDLLSSTSNGIQYPIDVRTNSEWETERIDTPFPEFPRHIQKEDIIDDQDYQKFLNEFNGKEIILYCKSGGRSSTTASLIANRGFNGTIYNMLGGISSWKQKALPTKTGNDKPNIPTIVDAPSVCVINQSYPFSVKTDDKNNDPLRYGWDFNGNGIVDIWTDYTIPSTLTTVENTFLSYGSFNVSVLAQDLVGDVSDFSTVHVVEMNNPPNPPVIEGKIIGKIDNSYEYTIVAIDQDNDELSYLIDWGDGTTEGWTRTRPSGESFNATHEWSKENDYTIKVKAKDCYEEESEWGMLEIKMPKTHFQLLLETFYMKLLSLIN